VRNGLDCALIPQPPNSDGRFGHDFPGVLSLWKQKPESTIVASGTNPENSQVRKISATARAIVEAAGSSYRARGKFKWEN
jgi:hypothetical protein